MIPASIDFIIFSYIILFALCCFIAMWNMFDVRVEHGTTPRNDDELYIESESSRALKYIMVGWACTVVAFVVGWCTIYFISR